MNFHIISDIHLEFRYYSLKSHINKENRNGIPENEEINLILAGDVGYPDQKTFKDFIKSVSKLYDYVFIISGNHEYYKKDIYTTKKLLKEVCDLYINIYFLDNQVVSHNNINIIGSTLWTYVDESDIARKYPINDYSLIKDFTINTSNQLYKEGRTFLEKEIEKTKQDGKECIVITHHIPSFSLIDSIYKDGEINSYFASNCDDLIKKPIKLWAYGHTHLKSNHNISDVELICNPKGYPNELSRYSKTIVFRMPL